MYLAGQLIDSTGSLNDLKKIVKNKQPLDFIRNMQLIELAPKLPVGKNNSILKYRIYRKRKIPLKDDEPTLHAKCYEALRHLEITWVSHPLQVIIANLRKVHQKIRQKQSIRGSGVVTGRHLLLLGKVYSNGFLFSSRT